MNVECAAELNMYHGKILYTAPGDYTRLLSQLFTFTSTQSSTTIVVGIVDDDFLEEPHESFRAIATLVSTDATGVNINPSDSVVTILDDEGNQMSFLKCSNC